MMNDMRKPLIIINLLLVFGCNKQSEALSHNEFIITEDVDGYLRDMHIQNDTLFVVNEDEGLLIYSLSVDSINNSLTLYSIYSGAYTNSSYIFINSWGISGKAIYYNFKRSYL